MFSCSKDIRLPGLAPTEAEMGRLYFAVPLERRAGDESSIREKDTDAPKIPLVYFGWKGFFGYLCKLF
jgi:hypothetical protein